MLVTLLGMLILVRPAQLSNAQSPMLVTLLGIVTLVIFDLFWKALFAMPTTDIPYAELGITTAPPLPV
jgi:hypothetical protein